MGLQRFCLYVFHREQTAVVSCIASYGEAQDWMRCFERLGHGELSPDQAIQQANDAIAKSGILSWAMPLALGLVDEQALCRRS